MKKKSAPQGIQIGDRVEVLHPAPFKFGYLERIDGAYHYVRSETNSSLLNELYVGEFKVVKRYSCRSLQVGQNVKLLSPDKLDWGKARPRIGGVVLGFNRKRAVVQTHAGRGRSQIFLIAPRDLEKCDQPLVTPPAPRLCPHCGGDLRKKPSDKQQ
jgi:hypothetical protein